jgi:hypothetical protein
MPSVQNRERHVKIRYMAMIAVARSEQPPADSERGRMADEYARFNRDARSASVFLIGEALQPVETATVVRVTESGPVVTYGPFTEAKEAVGCFYLLECETLDQAIEWAAKFPDARAGAIEVRPIIEMNI